MLLCLLLLFAASQAISAQGATYIDGYDEDFEIGVPVNDTWEDVIGITNALNTLPFRVSHLPATILVSMEGTFCAVSSLCPTPSYHVTPHPVGHCIESAPIESGMEIRGFVNGHAVEMGPLQFCLPNPLPSAVGTPQEGDTPYTNCHDGAATVRTFRSLAVEQWCMNTLSTQLQATEEKLLALLPPLAVPKATRRIRADYIEKNIAVIQKSQEGRETLRRRSQLPLVYNDAWCKAEMAQTGMSLREIEDAALQTAIMMRLDSSLVREKGNIFAYGVVRKDPETGKRSYIGVGWAVWNQPGAAPSPDDALSMNQALMVPEYVQEISPAIQVQALSVLYHHGVYTLPTYRGIRIPAGQEHKYPKHTTIDKPIDDDSSFFDSELEELKGLFSGGAYPIVDKYLPPIVVETLETYFTREDPEFMEALLKADDIYAEQNETEEISRRSDDPYSVVFVAQTPALKGEWVPSERVGEESDREEWCTLFVQAEDDWTFTHSPEGECILYRVVLARLSREENIAGIYAPIAVVSVTTLPDFADFSRSFLNHLCFCTHRSDYTMYIALAKQSLLPPDRSGYSLKLIAMMEALKRHSIALWLDRDSWLSMPQVFEENFDIRDFFRRDASVVFTGDGTRVNTGVFAVKNTTWGRDLLQTAYDESADYYFYAHPGDQAALAHSLLLLLAKQGLVEYGGECRCNSDVCFGLSYPRMLCFQAFSATNNITNWLDADFEDVVFVGGWAAETNMTEGTGCTLETFMTSFPFNQRREQTSFPPHCLHDVHKPAHIIHPGSDGPGGKYLNRRGEIETCTSFLFQNAATQTEGGGDSIIARRRGGDWRGRVEGDGSDQGHISELEDAPAVSASDAASSTVDDLACVWRSVPGPITVAIESSVEDPNALPQFACSITNIAVQAADGVYADHLAVHFRCDRALLPNDDVGIFFHGGLILHSRLDAVDRVRELQNMSSTLNPDRTGLYRTDIDKVYIAFAALLWPDEPGPRTLSLIVYPHDSDKIVAHSRFAISYPAIRQDPSSILSLLNSFESEGMERVVLASLGLSKLQDFLCFERDTLVAAPICLPPALVDAIHEKIRKDIPSYTIYSSLQMCANLNSLSFDHFQKFFDYPKSEVTCPTAPIVRNTFCGVVIEATDDLDVAVHSLISLYRAGCNDVVPPFIVSLSSRSDLQAGLPRALFQSTAQLPNAGLNASALHSALVDHVCSPAMEAVVRDERDRWRTFCSHRNVHVVLVSAGVAVSSDGLLATRHRMRTSLALISRYLPQKNNTAMDAADLLPHAAPQSAPSPFLQAGAGSSIVLLENVTVTDGRMLPEGSTAVRKLKQKHAILLHEASEASGEASMRERGLWRLENNWRNDESVSAGRALCEIDLLRRKSDIVTDADSAGNDDEEDIPIGALPTNGEAIVLLDATHTHIALWINAAISLKQVGVKNIGGVAYDEETYNFFKKIGLNPIYPRKAIAEAQRIMQRGGCDGFLMSAMYARTALLRQLVHRNVTFYFTDVDTVYLRNPMTGLENGDYDWFVHFDVDTRAAPFHFRFRFWPDDPARTASINTGMQGLRPTPAVKRLVDDWYKETLVPSVCVSGFYQTSLNMFFHLHSLRPKLNTSNSLGGDAGYEYDAFDEGVHLRFFTQQREFASQKDWGNPYVVHVFGHYPKKFRSQPERKAEALKTEGLWRLSSDWSRIVESQQWTSVFDFLDAVTLQEPLAYVDLSADVTELDGQFVAVFKYKIGDLVDFAPDYITRLSLNGNTLDSLTGAAEGEFSVVFHEKSQFSVSVHTSHGEAIASSDSFTLCPTSSGSC